MCFHNTVQHTVVQRGYGIPVFWSKRSLTKASATTRLEGMSATSYKAQQTLYFVVWHLYLEIKKCVCVCMCVCECVCVCEFDKCGQQGTGWWQRS